ncbi:MAG: DUF6691 family protein [Candidatus Sericytochromatia bacterium]
MNKAILTSFISGLIFSLGLGISGMMDTKKVHGFLDIFGKWDPSLTMVLGGAVIMTLVFFPIVFKRDKPILESIFSLPKNNKPDKKLITGAILFGIGWGLSGLCPGPAIANITTFNPSIIIFVICMLIGFYLQENFNKLKN